uniref:Uncharacterized protein n=1 Tax=Ixodes ricinus TaxID=34613 RepID=A0A6B0TVY8_IXORI
MGEGFVARLGATTTGQHMQAKTRRSTLFRETCSDEKNGSSTCVGTGFSSRSRSRLCSNHLAKESYELSSKRTEAL